MDESALTTLAIAVGVALLFLGSLIRRRARLQRRPPGQGGGTAPKDR